MEKIVGLRAFGNPTKQEALLFDKIVLLEPPCDEEYEPINQFLEGNGIIERKPLIDINIENDREATHGFYKSFFDILDPISDKEGSGSTIPAERVPMFIGFTLLRMLWGELLINYGKWGLA
jgi:hypothetical protein